MEVLKIAGNRTIPNLHFDANNNVFEIGGRSCPEDVAKFYQPLFDWLDEYRKSPREKTVFDFKLIYFNTASAKILLNLMQKIEALAKDGHEVLIRWHYPDDDEDLEEAGEDYEDLIEVPFEKIAYSLDD